MRESSHVLPRRVSRRLRGLLLHASSPVATGGSPERRSPSVREALPELQEQVNITLDLIGLRHPHLILRTIYIGQPKTGPEVRFNVEKRAFD